MNSDLISRSALLESMNAVVFRNVPVEHQPYVQAACEAFDAVTKTAPAVDAEPVRHGRYDAGGDCTVCGYPMPTDDRCDAIFPSEIKYCYNCGAKMDGDEHA